MQYIILSIKLVLLLAAICVALFIPTMIIWVYFLTKFDKDEYLVVPFLKNLRDSLGNGVKWVINREFPRDVSKAVLEVSQHLNRQDQTQVRNLSRVGAVVSDYALQYCRQSKEGELAKSRLRPRPRRLAWLASFYRQLFGYKSTAIDDAIDHSINYSFVHGKNFATERPEFYITPRTTEDEEKVENIFSELSKAVDSVRRGSEESLRDVFEKFVWINEYQSMTYRLRPFERMYMVVDPTAEKKGTK